VLANWWGKVQKKSVENRETDAKKAVKGGKRHDGDKGNWGVGTARQVAATNHSREEKGRVGTHRSRNYLVKGKFNAAGGERKEGPRHRVGRAHRARRCLLRKSMEPEMDDQPETSKIRGALRGGRESKEYRAFAGLHWGGATGGKKIFREERGKGAEYLHPPQTQA